MAVSRLFGLVFICAIISYGDADLQNGRLPLSVNPLHFNLEILPDFYDQQPPFDVSGKVDVRLRCDETTDRIYLNGEDLILTGCSIILAQDSPVQGPPPVLTSCSVNSSLQFIIVALQDSLTLDAHYILSINYISVMQSNAERGLYYDFYQRNGTTKYLAATQFQSHYTRRGFPSFDEPGFKSTFNVTLLRRPSATALANMPRLRTEIRPGGWEADVFETTPVMSAYLICFVISEDLAYLERTTSSGIPVRIWAMDDRISDANFANSISVELLDWFDNYTQVPYSLPKMDHIALPTKGGAMENWGLITYSQIYLLYNPTWENVDRPLQIALVMAHEIAHQWFGDLVTCKWWDDTWLNEGFANFFEFQPIQEVLGVDPASVQLAERVYRTLDADSVNTSVPVRQEVIYPWLADRAFGPMTYSKGGAVLRMLQQIFTPAIFRRAMTRYLNRHAYNNTVTQDLWDALSEQAEQDGLREPDGSIMDVKRRLDPWVNQMGHPLFTVDTSTPGAITIRQNHNLSPLNQTVTTPSNYSYIWDISVTYTSQDSPAENFATQHWFSSESEELSGNLPSGSWVLTNVAGMGFFRVQYDSTNFNALIQQLLTDHTMIPLESRAGLIDDSFALARATITSATVGMDTTRFLGNDASYLPWEVAARNLNYVTLMLSSYGSTLASLATYMIGIVDPVYQGVGWNSTSSENFLRRRLRRRILSLACTFGVSDCSDKSLTQFREWKASPADNRIAPDNRDAVYCSALGSGVTSDWDFAYAQYKREDHFAHTTTLLTSLGCSRESWVLERYLERLLDRSEIPSTSHMRTGITSLIQNTVGRYIVWNHLTTSWNTTSMGTYKLSVLQQLANTFSTTEDYDDLNEFFSVYPPQNALEQDTFVNCMKTVEANLGWIDRNLAALDAWLGENTKGMPIKRGNSVIRNSWDSPRYELVDGEFLY